MKMYVLINIANVTVQVFQVSIYNSSKQNVSRDQCIVTIFHQKYCSRFNIHR